MEQPPVRLQLPVLCVFATLAKLPNELELRNTARHGLIHRTYDTRLECDAQIVFAHFYTLLGASFCSVLASSKKLDPSRDPIVFEDLCDVLPAQQFSVLWRFLLPLLLLQYDLRLDPWHS